MSKAFKFTDNNYLDSTGIVHNREKLSEILGRKDDTLPIGSIVDFDGQTIPEGYTRYIDPNIMSETILFNTNTWDSMMKRYETKNIDFTPYTYVEVHFTGQGATNATNTILKIDLTKPFKSVITNSSVDYSYGASVCFPDIQLLQGSNNDPGVFRIGACISTDKKKIWMGDAGYFTGQTNSGNFDANTIYSRISKIVGFKPKVRIKKTQQPASFPNTNIHDSYSTGTSDTYTCNYINNKFGEIIESGGNETNGYYIRFKGNIQICYGKKEFVKDIKNAWGSVYESSPFSLGEFPKAFSKIPTITVSCISGTTCWVECLGTSTTHISGQTWVMRPVAGTGCSFELGYIAIGPWQ